MTLLCPTDVNNFTNKLKHLALVMMRTGNYKYLMFDVLVFFLYRANRSVTPVSKPHRGSVLFFSLFISSGDRRSTIATNTD